MYKSLIALSATLCMGLASTTGFAASHVGAPMKAASGATAPAATAPAAAAPMATHMSKTEVKAAKKKAGSDYKAAKASCKPMKGTEHRSCLKEAKAKHEQEEKDIKAAARK